MAAAWWNRLAAGMIGVMALTSVLPVQAAEPLTLLRGPKKKKKKRRRRKPKPPEMTPAKAAEVRQAVQGRAGALLDAGEPTSAGVEYDNAAAAQGDPVLYLDAGDAYLAGAEKDREPELCDAAAERGAISLDILYFHLDSTADPGFRFVEISEVPGLIARAQDLIENAEELKAEIDEELNAPPPAPASKKKPRKPGRAMVIAGAVSTVAGVGLLGVGFAGLGLGFKHQRTAVEPTVYGDEYDAVAEKGERANLLAYIGLPAGAILTGVGVTLIVLGRRKAKKAGSQEPLEEEGEPADESEDDLDLAVAPFWGRGSGGVAVSGRF